MSVDIIALSASLILTIPLYLWMSLAAVAVFRKAGVETWPAWIPVYNVWVLCSLAGITPWLALLCLIPPFIPIVFLVVGIQLSPRFGLSPAWCVLAAFCPPAYLTVLGWGNAHWDGPAPEHHAPAPASPSPRPNLDWLSNPQPTSWNGVSDATEIAAPAAPFLGESVSDTVRADLPAAAWASPTAGATAAPSAPAPAPAPATASPAYPAAPPLSVSLPDPIETEQTPDWRNLFASSADVPGAAPNTGSRVPASATEAPYVPDPAAPAADPYGSRTAVPGLAPTFFEYANGPDAAPADPAPVTQTPPAVVPPVASEPWRPEQPAPTGPVSAPTPAAAPTGPVSAPTPAAGPVWAPPAAAEPAPGEDRPAWSAQPAFAPSAVPPVSSSASSPVVASTPATEQVPAAEAAIPTSAPVAAAEPVSPAEPVSRVDGPVPAAEPVPPVVPPVPVAEPAPAAFVADVPVTPAGATRMREDSEVVADARASAVTHPAPAVEQPVAADPDEPYRPIVIPGPPAPVPPAAVFAPPAGAFAPAGHRDDAPSELSESVLDYSQEVSAVVGAPDAGAPRAARESVSAQARQTAAPADDDFEATQLASRRRPVWTLTPPLGGEVVLTSEAVMLGRRPAETDEGVQNVPVADGTRTVSKTHARLDLIDGVWWITDLASTNGVFLIDETGAEQELRSGVPAVLTERFLLGDAELRISRATP